jgi:poly-beta-1,6-N-acetyl-D-glucosamine synthase
MCDSSYILITPARNEAAYIEKTILSVVSQTILPKRWVIVNDRSTDNMGEVIEHYKNKFSFIDHVRVTGDAARNFGSKVKAFNVGFAKLENSAYAFIGNLDGDVSFEPNYYEMLIKRFMSDQKLGLAGGGILNLYSDGFIKQNVSLDSVAGATQFFRKKCFDDIGGYIPLRYGSVDTYVEVMARMKGWEVRTFPEMFVFHHRPVGQERGNIFKSGFISGIKYYMIGYDTLFFILKSIYRITDRPFFIMSIISMLGYFWAKLKHTPRDLPEEFINFFVGEQKNKLNLLFKKFNFLNNK